MLFKTKGIVLSYVKFRETSIIVKIYTEVFGIQSYIVNSVRTKNTKPKIALYQPLTLLDLVVYHKESVPIHRISEVRTDIPLATIPFEFQKSCIGIFLTEVLVKCLKEETENRSLFNFLYQSILSLDHLTKNFENFHIQFLLALTVYLGFAPESPEEILSEVKIAVGRTEWIKKNLESVLKSSYSTHVTLNGVERRELLDVVIKFYQLHIENFGGLKSLEVLKEIMK